MSTGKLWYPYFRMTAFTSHLNNEPHQQSSHIRVCFNRMKPAKCENTQTEWLVCVVQGGEYSDASCADSEGDGVRDANLQPGRIKFIVIPDIALCRTLYCCVSPYISIKDYRVTANGLSSSVGSPPSFTVTTQVFLTPTELHMLRRPPVDRACRYNSKKYSELYSYIFYTLSSIYTRLGNYCGLVAKNHRNEQKCSPN